MSAKLKLSGALPGIEAINGLDAFATQLAAEPDGSTVTAIVIFDVKEVKYSVAAGAHVPTVQVRRVEGWMTEDTPQAVRDALVARQEKRTGRTPLDFGVLEETKTDE